MSVFSVHFDARSIVAELGAISDDVKNAMRPAAQAGAQVLYDEVKKNVRRLGKRTGNLESSIYQVYSKDNSTQSAQVYHVSWNASKAPHGHLVEFGHIQKYQVFLDKKTGKWVTLKNRPLATPKRVPPSSFLRAAQSKVPQAIEAMEAEFLRQLEKDK